MYRLGDHILEKVRKIKHNWSSYGTTSDRGGLVLICWVFNACYFDLLISACVVFLYLQPLEGIFSIVFLQISYMLTTVVFSMCRFHIASGLYSIVHAN
jgi:hypothetical protein